MMIFYLKKLPDSRVYISATPPTKDEELLDEIKAANWKDARATCTVGGLDLYRHVEGYGYFDT